MLHEICSTLIFLLQNVLKNVCSFELCAKPIAVYGNTVMQILIQYSTHVHCIYIYIYIYIEVSYPLSNAADEASASS